ncbi:nucleolar pre-ribosomal-associated protein 1, partial [Trichonephila clavata]
VSIDEVCTGNTSCNLDLIDHLRQNFISYHSSAVEISLCDISNLMGCLSKTSVRKVIWQLLMYIDFETKLILRNESQNSSMIILDIQFLEEILTFFPLFKNKPNSFASSPKKRKKVLGQYIYQLLLQHPIYAFLFTEDSMMILLQHSSIQDLNILGVLIDYSNKFRQITETFISDSLEEANTVKFLYLASKCLCNAEKENKSETEFKDLIFSRFFDTFKEFVLSDLTNDLDILHNCTIGKSVQVLLQDKENSKILRHFCKSLMKNHSDEVPSVSKMHAILQLFHSWKLCSDNNKTRLRILKVCFLWLSTGLNTDFKNLELTNFIKEMIENMDCLEIDEVIDVTDFFQKSLKFALKSDDIGKDILKILCLLCEKSKGNHLPVQCIHGLVCGHSCFLKIMLTEKEKKNILKEHLIDLLTVLTKLDGSVCKEII